MNTSNKMLYLANRAEGGSRAGRSQSRERLEKGMSQQLSQLAAAAARQVQFALGVPAYPLPRVDDEYGIPIELPELERDDDSGVC